MIKLPYLLWKGNYCPIIEVEVIKGDKQIRTMAYVDTGATYSVFHSDFCEELGLSLIVLNNAIIKVDKYRLKRKGKTLLKGLWYLNLEIYEPMNLKRFKRINLSIVQS